MKIVEKKILPKWMVDVLTGIKTFEYRKDEDDIRNGDVIWLRE